MAVQFIPFDGANSGYCQEPFVIDPYTVLSVDNGLDNDKFRLVRKKKKKEEKKIHANLILSPCKKSSDITFSDITNPRLYRIKIV